MFMLTESYVSFEIAKLLKEKGFNEKVNHVYHYYTSTPFYRRHLRDFNGEDYKNLRHEHYSAPTLQMALKWLREVHKIEISISYGFPFIDGKQVFKYYWYPVKVTEKGLEYPMDDPNTAEFNEEMADSYEEAIEAALLYVLKILI